MTAHAAYLPVPLDLPKPPATRKALSAEDALWRNIVLQLAEAVRDGDLVPLPPPNASYKRPGPSRGFPTSGYYRIDASMVVLTSTTTLTLGCRRDVTSGQWRTAYAHLGDLHRALVNDYFDGCILSDPVFEAWETVAHLLNLGVFVLEAKPRQLARIVVPEALDEDDLVPLERLAAVKRRRVRPAAIDSTAI